MQTMGLKGFKLSTLQARLWSVQGERHAYCTQCAISLDGLLNIAVLMDALQHMLDKHEILRTAFKKLPAMEIPLQIVTDYAEGYCPMIALDGISSLSQSEECDKCFAALQKNPFDLEYDSLLIAGLLRLSKERHVLIISLPSLCADASTLRQIIVELNYTYNAYLKDESLDKELLQYSDISSWLNKLFLSRDAESQRRYWDRIDLSELATMRLPFEGKGRAGNVYTEAGVFDPQKVTVSVDRAAITQLSLLACQYEVSCDTWLLACWYIVLWRLSAERNLLIGVAYDGRVYEELANAIGLYTRFVPVGIPMAGDQSFEQMMALTHKTLQEAGRRQLYFTWGTASSTALDRAAEFFPVCFECNIWSLAQAAGDLSFSLVRHWSCTEPFALKLWVLQQADQVQLEIHYDARRFTPAQIQQLSSVFSTFLSATVAAPGARISALPLLSASQIVLLQQQFASAQLALPELRLHQYFEEQADRTPYQMAVLSSGGQMTYKQLNEQANQLAWFLRRQGVGPNVLVGLCLPRSEVMILCLLAVLKAGGAYLPLDAEIPPQRLAYQLRQGNAALLLSWQGLLDSSMDWSGPTLWLDQLWPQMQRESVLNLPVETHLDDLAYIIYTSGSTGMPKGVMIRQRSLLNYVWALGQWLGGEPGWHYATVSTLAADLGQTAIFGALVFGGCLQVLDYETVTSPQSWTRWNQLHPIDVLKIVPSHLSALLQGGQASQIVPRRALILGGERLTSSLLDQIAQAESSCRIYNHYGPTEATVGILVNALGVRPALVEEVVSLGKPLPNSEVYVFDARQQLVPPGVTGEIYVGGEGLALGYVEAADLTAERFVPHPFSVQAGARLYKTGDLGRYSTQGNIEFVGRSDSQVKLRGYRIELGEIEVVLRRHPQVREAIVTLQEEGEGYLVGYLEARGSGKPGREELQSWLCTSLPAYMVPSRWVWLETLPVTSNGKLDRKGLPRPEIAQGEDETVMGQARGPLEELLQEIWQALLGVSWVGIHQDFFQIGGHSLLAAQVIARVQSMLGVELSILDLFEAPTIAGLGQRVEQIMSGRWKGEGSTLVAVPRTQVLPLSFAQQRLWFLNRLEPENTSYNRPTALRLNGVLNVAALEDSLGEVIKRHEGLRTTFQIQAGRPIQIIHPAGRFCLPVIDLSALILEKREVQARWLARQEAHHVFQLEQGPLLRIWLLRLQTQEHVLLLTMHHIITDGWSNTILMHEVTTLYQALAAGRPHSLSPLPIQYADFALWQRQWLQGEVLETQLDYWKQHLTGLSPLQLRTDHPRPLIWTDRGAHMVRILPVDLQEELLLLSRRENVTLFMLLLAAFQVLLYRYSGQDDISVGSPIANRTRSELEGLIGFFVNTLVLRTDLSGDPSFLELLGRVRAVCLGAYAHQDVPFEHLVEVLQPERDPNRSPLFQIMFGVQQIAQTPPGLEGITINSFSTQHITTKFDFTFNVGSGEHGLVCGVEYSTALFEPETIEGLLDHWHVLLQGIVAAPLTRCSQLPLLSQAERHTLLIEWNAAHTSVPARPHLYALFEAQVLRTPDALALVSEDGSLSYAHVHHRANQLAHQLLRLGVAPDVLVGVLVERSPSWLLCLLAVLKVGGVYLPLDATQPFTRLWSLLLDADPALVLNPGELPVPWSTPVPRVVSLPELWSEACTTSDRSPSSSLQPAHGAYVIYTSGSTGTPKGVMLTHQGLCNLALAQIQTLGIEPGSHVLQFAAQNFDASLSEIMMALLAGASLYLAPAERLRPGLPLVEVAREWAITVLTLPPSALAVLPVGSLPSVQTLIVAGESCPAEVVQQWAMGRELWNGYGPTEATICASMACCRVGEEKPDLGHPLSNTQLYVLDAELQLVPPGVPGELYIAGVGLARGYLKGPQQTAERFVPHPYSQREGERLYKTGDRVCYRANGHLEFVGRTDHQVKVRGYRVELGEIEAMLQKLEGVSEGVVVLREDTPDNPRLVGYVVGKAGQEGLDGRQLRAGLQQLLPDYMLPAQIVCLPSLPQTSSGKVDRRALLPPEQYSASHTNKREEGNSPIEQLLQKIWGEVLEDEQIEVHDNFFDLGGHSLLATQVMARLQAILSVEIALQKLFEAPTIAKLAPVVEEALRTRQGIQAPPLVVVARTHLPLSYAQQRLWFLDQLEPGNTAYLISNVFRLDGALDTQALEKALQEVIHRHEILRTIFREHTGQPVQIIYPVNVFRLPLIDLRALVPGEREAEAQRLVTQERLHPCDLTRGPLMRICLLQMEIQKYVLMLTTHHIIFDGWSNEVFVRELTTLYQAFTCGLPSPLPPLPIQYADFAYWQRQWLQGEVLEAHLAYWTRQLAGCKPLQLPTDYPRPETLSYRGASHSFTLSPDLSSAIATLCRHEETTLFMTLLTAFQTLLYRYTGQVDVVVGTDIANRTHVETEALIGFFINLLVLRNDLSSTPTFREVLRRTREMVLAAYIHQDTPFEMLVERLLPEHVMDRMPLVQVLFVLQNLPSSSVEIPGLTLRHFGGSEVVTAKFDLALFMLESAEGLRGTVRYSQDLFTAQSIAVMMNRFEVLLHNIVASPDTLIEALDFYTEAEKAQRSRHHKDSLRKLKIARVKE